ncbi:bifunctional ADP-dependent NAD(P)H-hydrate dehydratase/NAD(P)H-hydrate epimerase [Methanofervidicoccus sp. A16]|uniref:NAD(P)H-hydrate dehydratase n=1 Tax=Methanofervidicoccus sp. A16 TaxID=2607662 RepID=UPI00118C16C0|nr:NAD(P)H-hydrate dehydratase [Methanofervidicoccus sp. A16]AXI24962.1 bifunctional ADP-dependent NAD(P)H-hydrate dehydratase/NAD(P)H-hydrate epimerase [Methanofervidicoccus sp. A16]
MDNLEIFYKLLREYYSKKFREYITPKEMNIVDNNCEYLGIPKILLMENAGKSVAEGVSKYLRRDSKNRVYVFCGLGNNGGDGFAAVRHLTDYCSFEDTLTVVLLGREEFIKTYEAGENFKILKNIVQLDFRLDIREAPCIEGILEVIGEIENNREDNIIVIDALLGTGIKGELREPFKTLVDSLNRLRCKGNVKIVSVDVETKGLKGDLIVTFHRNKMENDVNKTVIKKIGIPTVAHYVVGWGDMYALSKRDPNSHKGENGKVLVVGGSKRYFGAPILSALASSKIVDLTTVVSVKPTIEALRNYPHLIGYEVEGDYLGGDCIDEVVELSRGYDVVILGSGLGTNDDTKEFVNGYLNEIGDKKVVIDADAIKVIDYRDFEFKENFIFTPHRREFEYMGIDLEDPTSLEDIKSTILLKGRYDIVFNSEKIKINKTGNVGMTVGGTGDVLCGIVGALFSKNDGFISACCGVYINGYAGDMLLSEKGYYYTPMDLIECIPKVLSMFK